jgi:hypothetical protein
LDGVEKGEGGREIGRTSRRALSLLSPKGKRRALTLPSPISPTGARSVGRGKRRTLTLPSPRGRGNKRRRPAGVGVNFGWRLREEFEEGGGAAGGGVELGAEVGEVGGFFAEGEGLLGADEDAEGDGGAGEDVEEGDGFGEGGGLFAQFGGAEDEDAHELDLVGERGGGKFGEAGLFGGAEGTGVEAVFEGVGVASGGAGVGGGGHGGGPFSECM